MPHLSLSPTELNRLHPPIPAPADDQLEDMVDVRSTDGSVDDVDVYTDTDWAGCVKPGRAPQEDAL